MMEGFGCLSPSRRVGGSTGSRPRASLSSFRSWIAKADEGATSPIRVTTETNTMRSFCILNKPLLFFHSSRGIETRNDSRLCQRRDAQRERGDVEKDRKGKKKIHWGEGWTILQRTIRHFVVARNAGRVVKETVLSGRHVLSCRVIDGARNFRCVATKFAS